MADEKNVAENAAPEEKVTKKVAKKATKKVAKKATKKVAKKATKKATKKVAKKTTAKKAPAKKKTAKKATAKPAKKAAAKTAKKVSKKVAKKATVAKRKVKSQAKPKSKKVENRIEQLQAMLQENLSGLSGDKAEAMAKNIWLAGLGAYSRTYEELSERYEDVQEKYEEINEEGQKVFADLVKRGQSIQGDLDAVVSKGKETLEDRVEEIKSRFGGGLSSFSDIPERLREAAERVEEISKKLRKKK